MRPNDFMQDDADPTESIFNRPKSNAPKHGNRQQFSYARANKKSPNKSFNGLHRRRNHKWSW